MRKRILALVLAIALVLSTLCTGLAAADESAGYTSGTYTGEGQGFGGIVTVTITVDANSIIDVAITGDYETPAIGGAALSDLTKQVKDAQGAEIDGVSGASFTSEAVREATAKAVALAKGEMAETAIALNPGTYTATKEGFQRKHVTVSVTVDENSIQDVQIIECTDNPITIAGTPCRDLPPDILKFQTYNVDGVTGATFTSNAIRSAVRDCLDQAGGSEAFSASVEHTDLIQGEDSNTDILVIGGGAAGMTAAIEAYTGENIGEPSGLNVILIEKAGFLGGTAAVSGGSRYFYTDETGAYDDAWLDKVVESEKAALQPYMNMPFNEELMRCIAAALPRANKLLDDAGVVSEPSWGGYLTFMPCDDHQEPRWNGSYLAYAVDKFIPDTTIDLRLNTRAMSLITDDSGAVIGANVQDKTSTYNIYAKKVIMACGDFAHNPEMIEQYAPEFVGATPFSEGTNTGDGLRMATEIGAVPIGNTMMGTLGVDVINDYAPVFLNYGAGRSMFVNKNGERFCNETKPGYVAYHDVMLQDGKTGWGIVDSNNPQVDALIKTTTPEYVFMADTLEELAEILGIPAENLMTTVDRYNGMIRDGEDIDYGTALEDMRAIEEGPFYAFELVPLTLTSLVGVKVDGNCRLLREDGSVIPNVFGAGNMILGGNLVSYYVSGHGVGTALYSGDLAAQTAKAEIQNDK